MSYFTKDPAINVISKEDFEERVEAVFNLVWKTLSRSFGPYGAPTIILDYPYSHVTKDGYTIMKNLMMDTSTTLIDQSIFNMASDICGRLNYAVGDGTTTAVIATNGIYQRYRSNKGSMKDRFILPRDISRKYTNIKNDIETELRSRSHEIRSEDPNELYENIKKIVYISSNGDEDITNAIAGLYKELNFPAITCEISQDGITKTDIIDGYKVNLCINDKLYINSDEMVMNLSNADILIFGVRINQEIYEKILKPVNNACLIRGRHLIVAAPYYDDVALSQIIRRDLNAEYKTRNDVNMVLTTYQATSNYDRKLIDDFAILCNTMVIGRPLAKSIIEDIEAGADINNILYLDERNIPNTKCIGELVRESGESKYVEYTYGAIDSNVTIKHVTTIGESSIPVGFIRNAKLGLATSIFSGFYYDQKKYEITRNDAYKEMHDLELKYQKLGTFNLEVSKAQKRYYALNLKMGVISVGGDSELSQKMMKDTVDDAILAASSAFEHGVVLGCNTSLLQSIQAIMKNDDKYDDLDKVLIRILYQGFCDVYATVLMNAFEDETIIADSEYVGAAMSIGEATEKVIQFIDKFFNKSMNLEEQIVSSVICELILENSPITIHNILIHYGLSINKVFDVTTMSYSDSIINSTRTDLEVLTATIDLMGILISGNQLITTNRHNFT